MNKKDYQRHFWHEAIVLLGLVCLVCYLCRLWPIVILLIIMMVIAGLRLLYLMIREVREERSELRHQNLPAPIEFEDAVFAGIQRQISERLARQYPNVRWIWEEANAKERIMNRHPVHIMLNKAGGYCRALVEIRNNIVTKIVFDAALQLPKLDPPNSEETKVLTKEPEPMKDDKPVNYSLMAFEWVENNVITLNDKVNEEIGKKRTQYLIPAVELPEKACWQDLCKELKRNGIKQVACTDLGIVLKFTNERERRHH